MKPKDPSLCARQGCKRKATHLISIEVRVNLEHAPATSAALLVCKKHARGTTKNDVISDEGWQRIVDNFTKAGYQTPNRDLSGIKITPLH